MLDYNSQIKSAPILSLHAGSSIGNLGDPIILPTMLQIAGFFVESKSLNKKTQHVLQANAIRELSPRGIVINSIDDISPASDLLRMQEIIDMNFDLLACQVRTQSGTKIGSVTNFIMDGFLMIRQLVVKQTFLKSFSEGALYIPRSAILEIKGNIIIVEDGTKKIAKTKLPAKLDPNFVNPFAKNIP